MDSLSANVCGSLGSSCCVPLARLAAVVPTIPRSALHRKNRNENKSSKEKKKDQRDHPPRSCSRERHGAAARRQAGVTRIDQYDAWLAASRADREKQQADRSARTRTFTHASSSWYCRVTVGGPQRAPARGGMRMFRARQRSDLGTLRRGPASLIFGTAVVHACGPRFFRETHEPGRLLAACGKWLHLLESFCCFPCSR